VIVCMRRSVNLADCFHKSSNSFCAPPKGGLVREVVERFAPDLYAFALQKAPALSAQAHSPLNRCVVVSPGAP